jgi:hypothetical protein
VAAPGRGLRQARGRASDARQSQNWLQYRQSVTSRPAPRDLRASDSDRERVITLLCEAAGDGRLTQDEHEDRVERAYRARTLGELAALTTDLVRPSEQPIRLDGRRAVTGVFSRDQRAGRWVVPENLPVLAIFGDVELDLCEAILTASRTVVHATLIAGTIHLIVPDGVLVETTGTAVLTRKRIDRAARASRGGQAVIEVRTAGFGGTIRVTSPRPPRRLGGRRRGSLPW